MRDFLNTFRKCKSVCNDSDHYVHSYCPKRVLVSKVGNTVWASFLKFSQNIFKDSTTATITAVSQKQHTSRSAHETRKGGWTIHTWNGNKGTIKDVLQLGNHAFLTLLGQSQNVFDNCTETFSNFNRLQSISITADIFVGTRNMKAVQHLFQ